jgi:hypothetical protein
LGNPLAAPFPLLGAGYALQFLPAVAGPGFPHLPLLQRENQEEARFIKKKRQQKLLSLMIEIPENKHLILNLPFIPQSSVILQTRLLFYF